MDGMDSLCMSPSAVCALDLLNGTNCSGIELTTNLFRDHKPSMKGNNSEKLETYLRIRALPNSSAADRNQCYEVIDTNTLEVMPPKGSNANKFSSDSNRKRFNFNHIFDERADQLSIYDKFALPVVRRFLSGQNGLLFAYGITSSGKSYTMRGTTANPGVIPRALNTVFEVIGHKIEREVPNLKPNTFAECVSLSATEREVETGIRKFVFERSDESCQLLLNSFRSQMSLIQENSNNSIVWNDVLHSTFRTDQSDIRCSVWIEFFEIYKEKIYDLLDLEVGGQKRQKIMLLKDESDNNYVKGLRRICVSSAEDAYKVLLFGQNKLHISSTNLNKNSSRSHCAFNISLVSTLSNGRIVNINNLSICDLAGAERSEKANNTGERIREAGKINASLLSLSRCISTIRHNQKFEHEPSKKRLVNFRDSKLTQVFQPFLSGSGTAAMISNMNPSPTLFDETLFALNFTGVAAQVVVSSEVQRNKFHDSLKRLTQLWIQSSQRWSNFSSQLKPSKPSVSIVQTIKEEEEEELSEDECLDVTAAEMERRVDEITQMDLSRADPQEIEVLRTQIDFLVEKLKQTESDKFEMELEVRRQVVSEFNKLIKDMEEMAKDKDTAKKSLEQMMAQRLVNNENIYKTVKLEFESKIDSLKTENFELREKLCQTEEAKEDALNRVKQLTALLTEKQIQIEKCLSENQRFDQYIRELESQIFENQKSVKSYKDVNTSTLCLDLKDENNSAIEFLDSKDANTSTEHNCPAIEVTDKGVGNSFVGLVDTHTSTETREMCDRNTSASIEFDNKSTYIETDGLNWFSDKETTTECSDTAIRTDKSIATQVMTSSGSSPLNSFEDLVSKDQMKKLIEKYENIIKEKEGVIQFHRKLGVDRDQKLKDLEEEKNKLNDKINLNVELNLEQLLKQSKCLKPSSTASSVVSSLSSFTSKSIRSEDTTSISSVESIQEKVKKSAKQSSRKRKPNLNNSMDKRYLSSVTDTLDTTISEKWSQTSSESCFADEIGNDVYSTKKKTNKRKPNAQSYENEALTKGPESKRKRPPLKDLYCSPISPIPSVNRVTRSKAKKCIQF